MGFFSTKNSDGASCKTESVSTISAKDMAVMRERGARHENATGGMFSAKATQRRKAHDPSKADRN